MVVLNVRPETAATHFDGFMDKVRNMGINDFVDVSRDATKVGLFSAIFAEECFGRLEHLPAERRNFLRLLFAGVKLGFTGDKKVDAFDLFVKKLGDVHKLTAKDQLVLARLAAIAGSDSAHQLARSVSPWHLTLEERRLLWDIHELPSVTSRLPIVPRDKAGGELRTEILGPHTLVDGNMYGHCWSMVGVELNGPRLRPDAWLIKHALSTRYGMKVKFLDI
jgi:hypothetical protein